ncbi:hypothetical protein HYS01_00575 [Candidatus Saccharibacteria bacterium]|nr:hypothetical protein [Candidatus Saccharibacteria bacterium]
MIFESKTGFSEGSISLDKVNEERQLLAEEGGSKSREFVLWGLYIPSTCYFLSFLLVCRIGRFCWRYL